MYQTGKRMRNSIVSLCIQLASLTTELLRDYCAHIVESVQEIADCFAFREYD